MGCRRPETCLPVPCKRPDLRRPDNCRGAGNMRRAEVASDYSRKRHQGPEKFHLPRYIRFAKGPGRCHRASSRLIGDVRRWPWCTERYHRCTVRRRRCGRAPGMCLHPGYRKASMAFSRRNGSGLWRRSTRQGSPVGCATNGHGRRASRSASPPFTPFGSFPHASKNASLRRRSVCKARGLTLQFRLNKYTGRHCGIIDLLQPFKSLPASDVGCRCIRTSSSLCLETRGVDPSLVAR